MTNAQKWMEELSKCSTIADLWHTAPKTVTLLVDGYESAGVLSHFEPFRTIRAITFYVVYDEKPYGSIWLKNDTFFCYNESELEFSFNEELHRWECYNAEIKENPEPVSLEEEEEYWDLMEFDSEWDG